MNVFTLNVADPSSFAAMTVALMDHLIAIGWEVVESGDGDATHYEGGENLSATEWGNSLAWQRMQWAATGEELAFQVDDDADLHQFRVKYSPAAGFVGGTPDAAEVPSATDEIVVRGGGTDAAPTFEAMWLAGSEGDYTLQFAGDDIRGAFWCVGYADETAPATFLLFERVAGAREGDDLGAVMQFASVTAAMTASVLGGDFSAALWTVDPAGDAQEVALLRSFAVGVVFPGSNPDAFDGGLELGPAIVARSTAPRFQKGVATSLRWLDDNTGDDGTLINVTGDKSHVKFSDLALEWDGETEPANTVAVGGANVDGRDRLFHARLAAAEGTVSPAPGALAGSRQQARFTPVVYEVEIDDPSMSAVVIAKVGASPHTWHVVYDGSEFAPLFEPHSSVETSGDRMTFSILPTGGWWDDFTITVGEFQEAS
jgi:hypothetical protein